jgi:hypothetical protein
MNARVPGYGQTLLEWKDVSSEASTAALPFERIPSLGGHRLLQTFLELTIILISLG